MGAGLNEPGMGDRGSTVEALTAGLDLAAGTRTPPGGTRPEHRRRRPRSAASPSDSHCEAREGTSTDLGTKERASHPAGFGDANALCCVAEERTDPRA
jgi:hypothetical protein